MKLFKNRTSKLKEAYPVTVRTEFRETSFPEKVARANKLLKEMGYTNKPSLH
ncbi:hypothetical protein [Chitinophaga sp. XS-30]|uniref:hypothetical protein n=1 Tax=Chitinophaga sp. XS-30 TaxID=2604421 RepID=UPI00143D4534|nr:hypothetical protein [Chitinophaga sp. XS-30]